MTQREKGKKRKRIGRKFNISRLGTSKLAKMARSRGAWSRRNGEERGPAAYVCMASGYCCAPTQFFLWIVLRSKFSTSKPEPKSKTWIDFNGALFVTFYLSFGTFAICCVMKMYKNRTFSNGSETPSVRGTNRSCMIFVAKSSYAL